MCRLIADLHVVAADQRRHSTRSVKRRKFDDELVESSLKNKPEKQRTSSKTGSEVSFTGDGSVKVSLSLIHAYVVYLCMYYMSTGIAINN